MRNLLFATVALTALTTTPAVAQGCGMMGQSASASSAGGMMCGRPAATQAQMTTPQPGQPQQAGGCACCRNMAMMQRPGQSMPGMQMPEQQPSPSVPGTPSTPETRPPG